MAKSRWAAILCYIGAITGSIALSAIFTAKPIYELTTVIPVNEMWYLNGLHINSSGTIAGLLVPSAAGDWAHPRPAVWRGGQIQVLGVLSDESPKNFYGDINDHEEATGGGLTSDGKLHAVICRVNRVTDLGPAGNQEGFGRAINEKGAVAGELDIAEPRTIHAAFFSDGKMTDLGTLGRETDEWSTATAINNRGDIVGESWTQTGTALAVRWTQGKIVPLGALGGANSIALAINDRGEITGFSNFSASSKKSHAFLWRDGVMHDLGTLPGGESSSGDGINSRGEVVGSSYVRGESHGFLYRQGKMYDLNDLVNLAASLSGQEKRRYLGGASGINDRAQIVGIVLDSDQPNKTYGAYLLSPSRPVFSAAPLLLAVGSVAMLIAGFFLWRKKASV